MLLLVLVNCEWHSLVLHCVCSVHELAWSRSLRRLDVLIFVYLLWLALWSIFFGRFDGHEGVLFSFFCWAKLSDAFGAVDPRILLIHSGHQVQADGIAVTVFSMIHLLRSRRLIDGAKCREAFVDRASAGFAWISFSKRIDSDRGIVLAGICLYYCMVFIIEVGKEQALLLLPVLSDARRRDTVACYNWSRRRWLGCVFRFSIFSIRWRHKHRWKFDGGWLVDFLFADLMKPGLLRLWAVLDVRLKITLLWFTACLQRLLAILP